MAAITSDASTTTIAQRLSAIMHAVTFDDLPPVVINEAKRRLLDTFGCILAGTDGETATRVREAVLEGGEVGDATIIGTGERTSVERATLANCAALRQLDFMDGHPGPYPAHASFNVPPALAMAEHVGASGRDLILAVVLGYEVNIRLQLAIGDPDIKPHGWSGGTILGVSSAVAMGRLLGLSVDQLTSAIAIAGTHAPALDAPAREQMPASKTCVDGMVASTSVLATMLAKAGVVGPIGIFEGSAGMREAFARRVDEGIITAPLERFRILDVYTKRYNAVKCAQTAVGAALSAARSIPAGWRDIAHITIGLADRDCRQQARDEEARRRPTNRDTANHSVYYCVAAGLVCGDLGPDQFASHFLTNADVVALADRITLEHRPDFDPLWPASNPACVRITTRDGRTVEAVLMDSPGHPNNPMNDADLRAKFRALATRRLPGEQVEAVIEQLTRLDASPRLTPLTSALSVK